MSTVDELITTDPFGFECIEESNLEAAFLATGDKGLRLPRTCLEEDAERTPDVLAQVLGHDPSVSDWATYSYRWFRTNDPDRVLFVPLPDPLIPAVFLPDTLGFLVGSLCILALVALYRNMDDMENIR